MVAAAEAASCTLLLFELPCQPSPPSNHPRSRETLFLLHDCILAAHSELISGVQGRSSRGSHASTQHWVTLPTPPNIPTLAQTGTAQIDLSGLSICIHHNVTQLLQAARGPSFVAMRLVGSSFFPFRLISFLLERNPLCHPFVAASHSPNSCHPPISNYTLRSSPFPLVPPASHGPCSASRTAVRHRCRQGRVSHAVPGQALEQGQLES